MSRTVHIVDDDDAIREGLSLVLTTVGYTVHCWSNGRQFLDSALTGEPACALLDVRMPTIDGLAVQQELLASHAPMAVIILTGHADVPSAVRTLRAGAFNFLEKPVETAALLQAVGDALSSLESASSEARLVYEAQEKLASLSPRELEVLRGLADGKQNKSIAIDLQISPRTVEVYRANIMDKLQAASLSDVLYIAFKGNVVAHEPASRQSSPVLAQLSGPRSCI